MANRSRSILLQLGQSFSALILLFGLLPISQPAIAADEPTELSAGDGSVMLIENVGQFDDQALFKAWGGSAPMWLVKDGFWITLVETQEVNGDPAAFDPLVDSEPLPQTGVNIKIAFEDANPDPVIETLDRLETSFNYFLGNDPDQWHSNVPVWGGVRYRDLYPGIDLEVFSESGQVHQRLVVSEGADLNAVKLDIQGADAISAGEGGLLLSTNAGDFALPLLQVTGNLADKLPPLTITGGLISNPFINPNKIAHFTNSLPEGSQLLYRVLFGSESYDRGFDIAVDSIGRAYTTGEARSPKFPVTTGIFDPTHNGGSDVFVVRINPTGSTLSYATFLGGSSQEDGIGIAINENNEVFLTGTTQSTDFPSTNNAYSTTHNGLLDAYIAKLNDTGSELLYSTFVGGTDYDYGKDISLSSLGDVYITGRTYSDDFPISAQAIDQSFEGILQEAFVFALDLSDSSPLYSTFIGGSSSDEASGLFVDDLGYAYITGFTNSANFPTTEGAYDRVIAHTDAFVTKLNQTGSGYEYSTLIGGVGNLIDRGYSIFVDTNGSAYITGETQSPDYPTTPGAFDITYNDGIDSFITKLNPLGTALEYSTYLGGDDIDIGYKVIVDSNGSAYVTGYTNSVNFPTKVNGFDRTHNGSRDVFLVQMNNTGTLMEYGSFFGGTYSEQGWSIAQDEDDAIYIVGESSSYNLPVVTGSVDKRHGGDEVLVAKFGVDNETPSIPVLLSPGAGETIIGVPTYTWVKQLDAGFFIFEYDNNSDFSSPVFTSTEMTKYSYTPTDFNVGTFYWHVKAGDLAGNWSEWSTKRKVIIKPGIPGEPVLVSPANKAFTNDTTPDLQWNAALYGHKYKVQMSKSNTFDPATNLVDAVLAPGVLHYTLPSLANGKYYWRVSAINTLNQSGLWSPIRVFTIDTVKPAVPKLLSPANKSIVHVNTVFSWQAVTGASTYQISFSAYPGFSPILFTVTKLTDAHYMLYDMEDGKWYWRVRSVDKAGNMSAWSEIWLVTKN